MLKRLVAGVAAAGVTTALLGSAVAGAGSIDIGPLGPALIVPSTLPTLDPFSTSYRVATDEQWALDNGTVVLPGDFDGDGLSDLFFYGAGTRPDAMWLAKALPPIDGDQEDRFDIVARSLSGAYKPFVGDFDGNGSDDIFWYAPGTGPDSIWYHDDEGAIEQSKSLTVNGVYRPIVANFDQNEDAPSDDILWYSSSAGESLWSGTSGRTCASRSLGNAPNNATPLVGNWKPDAALSTEGAQAPYFTDVFFYAPGTAADSIWSFAFNGSMTASARTVNGTYIPIVGNFDRGTAGAFGGLSDVFWYAPGTAKDSVWMNSTASPSASITFTSVAETVNATSYRPFVVPSAFGPDTIVWNNPTGSDFFWHPGGAQGAWSKTSVALPADPGTRVPIVGLYDDVPVSNPSLVMALLDRDSVDQTPYFDDRTGELLPDVVEVQAPLPRSDIFWFGAGSTSELFWAGSRTTVTFRSIPEDVTPI